jgi:hypothetical protein
MAEPAAGGPRKAQDALVSLLHGEEVDLTLQPHPVAFIDLYLLWGIAAGLAAAAMLLSGSITEFLSPERLPDFILRTLAPSRVSGLATLLVFFLMVAIVETAVAFVRSNFWWLIGGLTIALGSVVVFLVTSMTAGQILFLPLGIALIGMSQIEFFRLSHRFTLTNRRIVFTRRFALTQHIHTEAYYHHITNLVVKHTSLERLVGAGTVIPVMASGLNVGSEVVSVTGHFLLFSTSGSRERRLPRSLPYLCFFGVRRPDEVAAIIGERVAR